MAANNAKQIETMEHVPAKEHGNGFPPFAKDTFASQLIWLALVFVALYLLMSRIALPRIGSILEARKAHVDGNLAEAARFKDSSDAAMAAYEKSLADARGRAQALANEARAQHAAEAEVNRKSLEEKLNARLAEAERSIAATKTAAMTNVHGIATGAASAIVERLIGAAPTANEVEAAVSDVIKR
jgi:F-type H+-transporting ATPase subunit b